MVSVAGRSREAVAKSDLEVKALVQEVVKSDLEVKALVQEVAQCAGPLASLTALNGRAKERLQRMRSLIERLERCALEQDRESARRALLADAGAHRRQLLAGQTALRRASLAASTALGARARDALLMHREEEEVVGGGGGGGRGGGGGGGARDGGRSDGGVGASVRMEARQRRAAKESLARNTSDITESLMNVSRMMTQQLARGEETVTTLATSSQVLQGTGEELKAMSGTLHLSHRLITKYRRREVTDRLLVLLALALFLATVAYILKKRIFHFL
uniref:Vesicle transport protein SEC20 n=1 Tax=Petromyzon marinus TaxID=7757 RepID=A0AAJ7XIE2_PETMA|nr:vesicle transport protein SEC20 [Petromyzon marinus]